LRGYEIITPIIFLASGIAHPFLSDVYFAIHAALLPLYAYL